MTNSNDAVEFLEQLRPGGPWLLSAIDPNTEEITSCTMLTADAARAFIAEHDGVRNLYYSVNPTRKRIHKKASKTDLAAIEYLPADLDPWPDETPEAAKARYLAAIDKLAAPRPAAIIDSGNGLNVLFKLAEPILLPEPVTVTHHRGARAYQLKEFPEETEKQIAAAEKCAELLMEKLGSVTGTQNIDRILRLPGTVNLPNAVKRAKGRVACPTRLIKFNGATCKAEDFPQAPQAKPKAARVTAGTTKELPKRWADLLTIPDNGAGEKHGKYASRSDLLFAFLTGCLRADVAESMIADACLDEAYQGKAIHAHCIEQSSPPDYVERQIERAAEKIGEAENSEIARLASLYPSLEYDREREVAAEAMGCRVTTLDRLVKNAHARLFPDQADDDKQGRAVAFPEPEPWPDAVNGAELLDDISDAFRRYVVMSEQGCHTAALWALHTHLFDSFTISPRLAISSPVKQCGKTTLLDVLARLVLRPLEAANVSAAVVFRVVEAHRPCLLIDEVDTFLSKSDELRGVLNSGHRRGGSVLRTVGEDHEPRAFATYSAVAFSGIGRLPDTLADRSISIALKRKLPGETTTSFRDNRVGHLDVLARKMARWAVDHAEQLVEADPKMPPGIHSRAADNWLPLLAIADRAGGEWPTRARAAATQAAAASETTSLTEGLLSDIRDIFAKRDKDHMASAALVADLIALEGRPWAEMGKARTALNANRLAKLLKPLGIVPEVIRVGEFTPRGYMLVQFGEAFDRYLPPEDASNPEEGGFKPQHRNKP